jgi:hypothetical protein
MARRRTTPAARRDFEAVHPSRVEAGYGGGLLQREVGEMRSQEIVRTRESGLGMGIIVTPLEVLYS